MARPPGFGPWRGPRRKYRQRIFDVLPAFADIAQAYVEVFSTGDPAGNLAQIDQHYVEVFSTGDPAGNLVQVDQYYVEVFVSLNTLPPGKGKDPPGKIKKAADKSALALKAKLRRDEKRRAGRFNDVLVLLGAPPFVPTPQQRRRQKLKALLITISASGTIAKLIED